MHEPACTASCNTKRHPLKYTNVTVSMTVDIRTHKHLAIADRSLAKHKHEHQLPMFVVGHLEHDMCLNAIAANCCNSPMRHVPGWRISTERVSRLALAEHPTMQVSAFHTRGPRCTLQARMSLTPLQRKPQKAAYSAKIDCPSTATTHPHTMHLQMSKIRLLLVIIKCICASPPQTVIQRGVMHCCLPAHMLARAAHMMPHNIRPAHTLVLAHALHRPVSA